MDDLISRQDAIDGIESFRPIKPTRGETSMEAVNRVAWDCAINCAESFVRTMPSAQPECKTGKWIPVTERLPEEEEVVLVWGGASVYTAKRHNEYGGLMWWKLNSKRHYCNPTHWMPLPEPPKEEREDADS